MSSSTRSKLDDKTTKVSFVSDDEDDDEDGRSTTASSSVGGTSTGNVTSESESEEEKSADGEADGEEDEEEEEEEEEEETDGHKDDEEAESSNDEETTTFTLVLQPSICTDAITADDVLPDLIPPPPASTATNGTASNSVWYGSGDGSDADDEIEVHSEAKIYLGQSHKRSVDLAVIEEKQLTTTRTTEERPRGDGQEVGDVSSQLRASADGEAADVDGDVVIQKTPAVAAVAVVAESARVISSSPMEDASIGSSVDGVPDVTLQMEPSTAGDVSVTIETVKAMSEIDQGDEVGRQDAAADRFPAGDEAENLEALPSEKADEKELILVDEMKESEKLKLESNPGETENNPGKTENVLENNDDEKVITLFDKKENEKVANASNPGKKKSSNKKKDVEEAVSHAEDKKEDDQVKTENNPGGNEKLSNNEDEKEPETNPGEKKNPVSNDDSGNPELGEIKTKKHKKSKLEGNPGDKETQKKEDKVERAAPVDEDKTEERKAKIEGNPGKKLSVEETTPSAEPEVLAMTSDNLVSPVVNNPNEPIADPNIQTTVAVAEDKTDNVEDQPLPVSKKSSENEPESVLEESSEPAKKDVNQASIGDTNNDEEPDRKLLSIDDQPTPPPTPINEETEMRPRRNSIDEFIRRILAEAREEQKRLLNSVAEPPVEQPQSDLVDAPTSTGAATAAVGRSSKSPSPDGRTRVEELRSSSLAAAGGSLDILPPRAAQSVRKSSGADADIEEELAVIGQYFARSRAKADQQREDEDVATADADAKAIAGSADVEASLPEVADVDATALLPPIEHEFSPQRREETAIVVKTKVRPVRALLDAQTEIISKLKSAARQLEELDNEFRDIRQRAVERRTMYDTVAGAIREEIKAADVDQQAADERVQQQRLPGGRRFVRAEFEALCAAESKRLRPGIAAGSATSAASEKLSDADLLPPSGFRRRSGSVSGGYISVPGANAEFRTRTGTGNESAAESRTSVVDAADVESLIASRQRRSHSVVSERSYAADVERRSSRPYAAAAAEPSYSFDVDHLSRSSDTASDAGSWSYRRRLYDASDDADDVAVSRKSLTSSTYGTTRGVTSTGNVFYSYRRPEIGAAASSSSYGTRSYSSYSAAPSYSSTATAAASSSSYSSYRRPTSTAGDSSSYTPYTPRRYSTGYIGSASTAATSYGSSSGVSGSADGEEFRSRFLDKVREKRLFGGDSTTSATRSTTGDKPFKSRFLRSSSIDSPSKPTGVKSGV